MVNSLFSVLVFVLCCWHASSFTLHGAFKTRWGRTAHCPRGTWAIGFTTKVERKQGSGDDTAMNGIGLICGNRKIGSYRFITSAVGPWGNWRQHCATCMRGFIGARLKVEKQQGRARDDSSTNSVQLRCKSGTISEALNAGPWGSWRRWGHCPTGLKIIGIQTMVEPKQGKGDDTALNSVRFFCGK